MDLTGTPGLIDNRGGLAVLEREEISAPMRVILPPKPTQRPMVLPASPDRRPAIHLREPAEEEMFRSRDEEPEDGLHFPVWLIALGLAAFSAAMGIAFFGVLVPAVNHATPVRAKAAVPILALAYALQRPGSRQWLAGAWVIGKQKLAVRTHQFKRLGIRPGLGGNGEHDGTER